MSPASERRRRPLRIGIAVATVVVIAVTVLVVAALASSVRVRGDSMRPTLADGERVLVLPGTGDEADRFTIVVFHVPQESGAIVKRVIAVAGDRIAIDARHGAGVVLLQKRGAGPWYRVQLPSWRVEWAVPTSCCTANGWSPGASGTLGGSGGRAGPPVVQTVPSDRFFYLGDNPDRSDDARAFGWGEVKQVDGRVVMGLWPLSRLGGFDGTVSLTRAAAPR